MSPQFSYVINYFRKLYNLPSEIEIGHGTQDKKINIAAGDWDYFHSLLPYSCDRIIWKKWKDQKIPFLFSTDSNLPLFEKKAGKVFIHYDIIASAFFFLSGWQEYVFMKNKPSYRFPYKESLQSQLNITQIPVVNYYFDLLKEAIESVYNIRLKCELFTKPVICLTHDIDRTNSGWKEDGMFEFKKGHFLSPIKFLVKNFYSEDVWFNFEEILTLEKKYSAKSSFYFLPRKGRLTPKTLANRISESLTKDFLKNADYDIRKKPFQEIMVKIKKSGSEVGLHGGFGAHLDLETLQNDIERLGVPAVGGRFHNLLFDMSGTFDLLEKAGLKYDSTLGFAEEIGFRNGITFPFRPYNFEKNCSYNIVEIPLMVMDTTFRIYKKTHLSQIIPEITRLLKEVERFNGILTILWHNNYFSPYKFAGWKEVYEDLLKKAQENDFDLLSGKDVFTIFSDE